MFLVPMDTPGIRVVPMKLQGDHNINYTFFEDVRVPATSLVGGENEGWKIITNQLNHERVTLCAPGMVERSLQDVRAWAQATKLPDGRRVIDQEWVQEHLARVYAELEFLRLINWKVAWQATQGQLDVADASSIKVFGTEFNLRAIRALMEIVGQAGVPHPGLARRGHRRPARDAGPFHHHPDLRWRHQRDPARPHRHLRPRHAPVPALSPQKRAHDKWISPTAKSRKPSASWPAGSSPSASPMSASRRSSRRPRRKDPSTAPCGASWPMPASSVSPSTRSTAAPVSTSWPPAWSSRPPVAPRPTSRWSRRLVYGAAPIAQFGTAEQRQAWLPGVSSGDTILTAAMAELVGEVILPGGTSPTTTAQRAGRRLLGARRDQGLRAGGIRGQRHPRSGHACRRPTDRSPAAACSSSTPTPTGSR